MLEELLRYDESPYLAGPRLSEVSNDCSEFWREALQRAQSEGYLAVLEQFMAQLRFPVAEGTRLDPEYRSATLQGREAGQPGALGLEHRDGFRFTLHPTPIGLVPALLPKGRKDFELLVQALISKNEPRPVPSSMGAAALSGYNNWGRIHDLRSRFEEENPQGSWPLEFARLRATPEIYQDRLFLISDGPYSNVEAESLDLDASIWPSLSQEIRLHHESFHLFCKNLYGTMQTNALDEVLADYSGVFGATGEYRPDWVLRFLGVENASFREGGRLRNYCVELSNEAFTVLCSVVRDAVHALQAAESVLAGWSLRDRQVHLLRFSLLEIAEGAASRL